MPTLRALKFRVHDHSNVVLLGEENSRRLLGSVIFSILRSREHSTYLIGHDNPYGRSYGDTVSSALNVRLACFNASYVYYCTRSLKWAVVPASAQNDLQDERPDQRLAGYPTIVYSRRHRRISLNGNQRVVRKTNSQSTANQRVWKMTHNHKADRVWREGYKRSCKADPTSTSRVREGWRLGTPVKRRLLKEVIHSRVTLGAERWMTSD